MRRLWLALALGLPLIATGVIDAATPGSPLMTALGHNFFLVVQAVLGTLLVLVCGAPFLYRVWVSVRTRRLTMDSLLGVGLAAVYAYSLIAVICTWSGIRPLAQQVPIRAELGRNIDAQFYTTIGDDLDSRVRAGVQVVAPYQRGVIDPFFESVAAIVLLALIGRVLELRAQERSAEALRKLVPLRPTTARVVLADGREEDRPMDQVRSGDLIRVRPDERVPVDGVVRDGMTTVDESSLTGEPMRAERGPGGRVLAGSVNGLRPVTVEVVRVGDDTVLGQVIGIIDRALQRRVTTQRTTDRMASWFVPLVLAVAVGTFIGWAVSGPEDTALVYAALCAITVLVVACPCAIGLATPLAVVIGMRRAVRAGVIFREGAALERLASVDTVLFDKTGTLTQGRAKLAAISPNRGVSENAVLAAAAAVERGSEHPIGLAIVWEAVNRGLELVPAEGVQATAGKGVRGVVAGRRVAVGRVGFLQESGVFNDLMFSEAMSHRQRGNIVVFVGEGDRCIGVIAMSDPIRPTARAAVEQLNADGVRVMLVTGDHLETAQAVARLVGIDDVAADALPAEKCAVVEKLKCEGRVVAMCGDGVNDAPALVAADVGIAMGHGTPAAIGTAGMTLVQSDPQVIAVARQLSRATVRTIRQNQFFAFAFNALAIPVAAGALVPFGGGLINSLWATAVISLSALAILANSLRLTWRSLR